MADISKIYAQLDGAGQHFYATDANFPESGITGDLTIQAWVKVDAGSVSAINDIVRKWDAVGQKCYLFRFDASGKLTFTVSVDGTASTTRTSTPVVAVADTWVHVAVTYDASDQSCIFYVDGAAVADDSAVLAASIFDGTSQFTVGSHVAAENLDGGIVFVAIFDDIRTPTEILYSYQYPKENLSTEGNIIAYWWFNDLSTATAIDNGQGDSGRDLIPTDGGDTTYRLCGRTTGGTVIPLEGFGVGTFGTLTFGLESKATTAAESMVATAAEPLIVFKFTPAEHTLVSTGIAFVDSDPDTITDSGNEFVDAGFVAHQRITIAGSTSNDGAYTIASVTDGVITLISTDSLTAEAAGDVVTVTTGGNFRYYNEYVIQAPNITRGGTGMLSAGAVSIILDNTDDTWNIFRLDMDNLGQPCSIGINFVSIPGTTWFFHGTVEGCEYDLDTVTLTLHDKFATALARTAGQGKGQAAALSAGATIEAGERAGDLLWTMLTNSSWGDLDDTADEGNKDIDYGSYLEWFDATDAKTYLFRGRFPGITLQNGLSVLAELTNSLFWVDNTGRINFTLFDPNADVPVSNTLTEAKCYDMKLPIVRPDVINTVIVYYGYDYLDDSTWVQWSEQRTDYQRWVGNASTSGSTKKGGLSGTGIAFVDSNPDTITDSGSGFLDALFEAGDGLIVAGSASNDGKYTIDSVTAGTLTLIADDSLTAEAAGANVKLIPVVSPATTKDGLRLKVFEQKTIVHVNATGAKNFANDYLQLNKDPQDRIQAETPLFGFMILPGTKVRVNNTKWDMTAITGLTGSDDYIIDYVRSLNLGTCTARLEGRCTGLW